MFDFGASFEVEMEGTQQPLEEGRRTCHGLSPINREVALAAAGGGRDHWALRGLGGRASGLTGVKGPLACPLPWGEPSAQAGSSQASAEARGR